LTLVELLFVIAIISLLMAVLLSALKPIWRRAVVLACPIAYVDASACVWICDPSGQRQLLVSRIPATGVNPRWSPRGDRIAYGSFSSLVVVNPATGQVQEVEGVENAEWVDSDTLVGTRCVGWANELWRVDLRTGKAEPWKRLPLLGDSCGHISSHYQPILTPGFVVAEGEQLWNLMMDIVLRSKQWELKKTIWADPSNDVLDDFPKIDHLGEWIAWSRARTPGPTELRCVAIKNIRDHSTKPPELLGLCFPNIMFCDWTPQGDLLVAIDKPNGPRVLAIMRRDGALVRELDIPESLFRGTAPVATWRRYERW
jgi:hypothetical protein